MNDDRIAGVFREYDIRGIAGEELTPDFARKLGKAYVRFAKRRLGKESLAVSVGRDVRLSSDFLRDALVEGLVAAGADVFDLSACPTPLLYYSLFHLEADGGLMITGSHNPADYNGFKICIGDEAIHGQEIQALKEEFFSGVEDETTPGTLKLIDIATPYQEYLISAFASLPKVDIKVAVDAGNGTGGIVATRILEALGCKVVPLYLEPDGRFPNHHPDPTVPAFLEVLKKTVLEQKCDFGIAFDGDADRIGVIDDQGKILWGDKLMILFAQEILREHPGATFIGEVKCSQTMYDEIARLGGNPVMWKTGHSLIKDKIKEVSAHLAGEMSGHFFFADRYFGFDDAIYAACRVVEIAKTAKAGDLGSISDLLSGVPTTFFTPEIRRDCPEERKRPILDALQSAMETHHASGVEPAIREIITVDGLRVIFDDGWGLVRASNTQPVLVLRFEARTPKRLERIEQFMTDKLAVALRNKEE